MLPRMAARWYGLRMTVSGFASSSLKLSLRTNSIQAYNLRETEYHIHATMSVHMM